MVKKKQSSLLRSMIRLIQMRYSFAYIFAPRSAKGQAKFLARTIREFSDLYSLNPRAPHHVRLYPFCGVPVIGALLGSKNFDLAVLDIIQRHG